MANIRTARRSGLVLRGGKNVRETIWLGSNVAQVTLASASNASLLFSFNAAALALTPFTIVRTRGIWHCQSDQAAADERYQVAIGFAVVTSQAVAIGVTALPTPATDSSSDAFYLYQTVLGAYEFGAGVTAEMDSWGIMDRFDSKAMRKVEDEFDSVTVVETFATSSGVVIDAQFRHLVKLH